MGEMEELSSIGFRFKKHFGQNFITDKNLLAAIADDAGISASDTVVEVGAGAGALTKILAKKAGGVISYEIDKSLMPVLDRVCGENPNLELRYKDILKEDKGFFDRLGDFKVVANLPYYIATPVIFYFLDTVSAAVRKAEDGNEKKGLLSVTVMVQKEVAERFTAAPGSSEYGAVTAALGVYGEVKITRFVSRSLFIPAPDVDSAVVHLKVAPVSGINDLAFLKKVIAAAFRMRRKTLVNNLADAFNLNKEDAAGILEKLSLPAGIRGETLSAGDFVKLASALRIWCG